MASKGDYTGRDIPARLWRSGRKPRAISPRDMVYLRHDAMRIGTPYGFIIPGHPPLEDQSFNSHEINRFGTPRDVLFDTQRGEHHWDDQIACLEVKDLSDLKFPNEDTIQWRADGSRKSGLDIITFELRHAPIERMYPRCVLEAKKNGVPLTDLPKPLRTILRARLAELAERNREPMAPMYRPKAPVKRRWRDSLLLGISKLLDWWRPR
jgi:hypothetical protein